LYQHRHHLGPLLGLPLHAQLPNLDQPLEVIVAAFRPRILQLHHVPLVVHHVIPQKFILPLLRVGGRGRRDLEQDHPEAVGVHFGGELLVLHELVGEVGTGAVYPAHFDVVGLGALSGQSEVPDPRDVVRVQEDVGGLDVAVDEGLVADRVQELQPSCGTDGYLEAGGPGEDERGVADVEAVLEGAARHILVDQARLGAPYAVSEIRLFTSDFSTRLREMLLLDWGNLRTRNKTFLLMKLGFMRQDVDFFNRI
jgi:hypothetical protein